MALPRGRLITAASVLTLLLMVGTGAWAAGTPAESEWQTLTDSGIELQYLPEQEDLAHELLPELAKALRGPDSPLAAELAPQLAQVVARRMDSLEFLATRLGVLGPGPSMLSAFDGVVAKQREVTAQFKELHRFRLWHREKLLAALRAGAPVPCFEYDAAADSIVRVVSFGVNTHQQPELTQWPVLCSEGETVTGIVSELQEAFQFYTYALQQFCAPYTVYHETAEIGLVQDAGLRSAFRRWFCDGAAQYLAEETVLKFFGSDDYQKVAAAFDAAKYEDLKPKVDLLAWRAKEWEASMPAAPGVQYEDAHYAFALAEVRKLAARHGPEVIAQVVRQLSKTPPEQRTSRALQQALQEVTGDDPAPIFAAYGAEAKDPFRGIAIGGLQLQLQDAAGGPPTALAPGEKATLSAGGRRTVRVRFTYELLDAPVAAQFGVGRDGANVLSGGTLDGVGRAEFTDTGELPEEEESTAPQTYTCWLAFDGARFAEWTVVLTPPAPE